MVAKNVNHKQFKDVIHRIKDLYNCSYSKGNLERVEIFVKNYGVIKQFFIKLLLKIL